MKSTPLFSLSLLGLLVFSAPAQSQSVVFPISAYQVTGNQLVSDAEIAQHVRPFTGEARNFADVQRALEAIERIYRERGFAGIQVTLPEQELDQGVVRMTVLESAIKTLDVQGNQHFSEKNILAALPSLRIGYTPNARDISASVQLANENPAKKIDVVLGVGKDGQGIDARIDVKDEKPWAVYLTADNTGNASTGRDRVGVSLQHANLFDRDHVATASYTTSLMHPERTRIYSLSYRLPLYQWGDSVDFILGYSNINAGSATTVAGPLQFSGTGSVVGLRYNWILPRVATYSQRFIFGLDQRAYDNSCTVAGNAVCGAGGADISVRPLSVTYTGQWDLPGSVTLFSGSLAANWAGGSNGLQEHFTAARLGANKDYRVMRGSLSHLRAIAGDWQLKLAANAQYTPDALVSGEQFGLAGSTAVRGFNERAVAVDQGYVANLEIHTPDLPALRSSGEMRLLAFYDMGRGRFNQDPPGLFSQATVSSAGFGVRYAAGRQVQVRFDLASIRQAGNTEVAQRGDWRGHLAFSLGF